MPDAAPAKQQTSATIPYEMIKTIEIEGAQRYYNYNNINKILHLPGGQRIIIYSFHGSFRVWDLETGAQVGEKWEHEGMQVMAIALSPDGKTLASGDWDGAVRLWNIDAGNVVKKWTGHTRPVESVCWSSDGGRVVSGSEDKTFRVWDVETSRIILGPIKTGKYMYAACYSPDAKMIATAGDNLRIWDANTGELLTTIERFAKCLVWTSDGKTLIAAGNSYIIKFDTATWSETATIFEFEEPNFDYFVSWVLLSPNDRILASGSYDMAKTPLLWNLETNQPIAPLHHEDQVTCTAFSADGMFLTIGCTGLDGPVYKWDLSAIVKDASLLSNNLSLDTFHLQSHRQLPQVDAARRPVPKIKVAPPRRIPPGFFDDARRADLSTSRTQSYGQHDSSTTPPRQRTLPSFWRRRFNRNGATEHGTQSWSSPFSWTRNLVSGMVRRRNEDIELREPPIVEVPCTAGKPRNYHARKKKPTASSSQRVHAHPSQQPPPTATASTLPAVTGAAGTTGTVSRPHIAFTGWRARLLAWVCCIPIQNAN